MDNHLIRAKNLVAVLSDVSQQLAKVKLERKGLSSIRNLLELALRLSQFVMLAIADRLLAIFVARQIVPCTDLGSYVTTEPVAIRSLLFCRKWPIQSSTP